MIVSPIVSIVASQRTESEVEDDPPQPGTLIEARNRTRWDSLDCDAVGPAFVIVSTPEDTVDPPRGEGPRAFWLTTADISD
jgi:hypothetical protein